MDELATADPHDVESAMTFNKDVDLARAAVTVRESMATLRGGIRAQSRVQVDARALPSAPDRSFRGAAHGRDFREREAAEEPGWQ
jgi:hypothetical protein